MLEPSKLSHRRPLVVQAVVGAFFAIAGLAKLFARAETASVLADHGIFAPNAMAVVVAVFELACGALLLARWHPRWVAFVLGVFVLLATAMLHLPLVLAGPRALELALDVVMIGALYWIASRPGPHHERRLTS
jgi:uncharacterized membrane protein YphA (DoxX/SURF4 family)